MLQISVFLYDTLLRLISIKFQETGEYADFRQDAIFKRHCGPPTGNQVHQVLSKTAKHTYTSGLIGQKRFTKKLVWKIYLGYQCVQM